MAKFSKLQAACDKADEALRDAINKMFPVGTRVRVNTGNGWLHGEVAFESRFCGHTVTIRSDAGGRIHHKGYQYVELE